MSWVDDIIKDFGLGMGIKGLAFNETGVVCLAFETRGTLFIEREQGEILMYLVRETTRRDLGLFGKALELCHYRKGLPMPVNPGVRDESRLVFLTRIPERDFSLPTIEKTLGLLAELHDKVSE